MQMLAANFISHCLNNNTNDLLPLCTATARRSKICKKKKKKRSASAVVCTLEIVVRPSSWRHLMLMGTFQLSPAKEMEETAPFWNVIVKMSPNWHLHEWRHTWQMTILGKAVWGGFLVHYTLFFIFKHLNLFGLFFYFFLAVSITQSFYILL